MQEIEKDTNTWEHISWSWIGRTPTVKISIFQDGGRYIYFVSSHNQKKDKNTFKNEKQS